MSIRTGVSLAFILSCLAGSQVIAQEAETTFPPCDQEMTTCPCDGVMVDRDLVRSGDVLMLRLGPTSVISFPFDVR